MKKYTKAILGVAAAAMLGGSATLPAIVSAWGDSDGGRPSYTIDQINSGVLGDKIVMNSISNSVIGDEKNFVGARLDDGDKGVDNVWDGNEIVAEDGRDYLIRLYVHNNSPKGEDAVATGVTTTFSVPGKSDTSVEVNGFIDTDNASPLSYWDNVVFKSANGEKFHLEYYDGSALLENNGIGAGGGIQLSDEIITNGVKIGYDALDGRIPGCYQYASYVGIKVKVVYDERAEDFTAQKRVRKAGETEWKEVINAEIGDEVEYIIYYKNTSDHTQNDVMLRDSLPNNMQYIPGTTMLYNANYKEGIVNDDDTLTTSTGINIGNYAAGSNAYVIFRAKVVDNSLECGSNQLVNWGQVTINNVAVNDDASVMLTKVCPEPEPVYDDYTVSKQVRKNGEDDWKETVSANVRDEVEFRIVYQNTDEGTEENVMVSDTLPKNLEYVAGSTVLYNEANPNGKAQADGLTTGGINIGSYEAGEIAYVVFKAKVIDEDMECGDNSMTNWGQVTVNDVSKKDDASVTTNKVCPTPQPEPTPDPTPDPTPTPTPTPETYPVTGPELALSGVVGAGSVTTAAGYYVASRKNLKRK